MNLALGLVPVGTFLALAAGVLLAGILPGDAWLRDLVLARVGDPALAALRWINHAGTWPVLAPAALVLLAFPRVRRRWWVWLAGLLAAPALEGILKWVIARPRPEAEAYGFPSGHATAAAAYFGALIYAAADLPVGFRLATRAGAAALIALVALARVALRAHWPSDALGGIALGLACVVAAAVISSSTRRFRSGPTPPPAPSPAGPWQRRPGHG